jgi:hypothetical protein
MYGAFLAEDVVANELIAEYIGEVCISSVFLFFSYYYLKSKLNIIEVQKIF